MPRGATARLFVALDPPAPVCEELAAWARGAATGLGLRAGLGGHRPLRLLERHALHLTMCFLGSRPFDEIEGIGSAIGACHADIAAAEIGPLSVGAPLWLPPRRPRTLVVEIRDEGGWLDELHSTLTRAISRASNWEPDRRRFRAHVTVARIREGALSGRRSGGQPPGLPATPAVRFTPEALVLYRSRLDPAGAIYEPIVTYDLIAPTSE